MALRAVLVVDVYNSSTKYKTCLFHTRTSHSAGRVATIGQQLQQLALGDIVCVGGTLRCLLVLCLLPIVPNKLNTAVL